MDLNPPEKPEASIREFPRSLWRRAAGIRNKALLVLATFLTIAGLMAVHTALNRKDATLRLKVEHNFRSAQLWVWLDEGEIYSGTLIGSGKTNRTNKMIRSRRPVHSRKKEKVESVEPVQGSLSETFPVSAGAHQVRIRVANEEDGSVQENSLRGDFLSDGQHTLSVVARANDVSMSWETESQGKTSTPASGGGPAQAPESWFQRYSGSLLISIVGSVVSAVTGYVIKELPKKITSTQAGHQKPDRLGGSGQSLLN